jgi:hypothetical protein
MKRNATVSAVWGEIEKIRNRNGLPERCDLPLMDAAFGYKVRNQRYREDQEISDVVASRDLKKLCEAGLLEPVGEKRGRYYVAGEPLKVLILKHKDNSRAQNPYEILSARVGPNQLSLAL